MPGRVKCVASIGGGMVRALIRAILLHPRKSAIACFKDIMRSHPTILRIAFLSVLAGIFGAAVLLNLRCSFERKQIVRSFYYWQSRFDLSDPAREFLKQIRVSRIYLHFFDVVWNARAQEGVPVAVVQIKSPPDSVTAIVPVVYVTNETLRLSDRKIIPDLARNIHNQAKHIAKESGITFDEFQIDCDWSLQTRDKYFLLLSTIRSMMPRDATLSATIRLHQLVHPRTTGVPPVDRGMLMFYNMGRKMQATKENSIFTRRDAKAYLDQYKDYLLPLDVALPHYEWVLHFRNGTLIDVLQALREEDIRDAHIFSLAGSRLYRADGSFVFHGTYVVKGDMLKVESVTTEECAGAAEMLARTLDRSSRAVAIFALDSSSAAGNRFDAYEKIFSAF